MKSWMMIALLVSLTSACAIRANLDTPFTNPENKPGVDVPGDASKGTKYCMPDADDNFDGQTTVVDGGLGDQGIAWADGGGCVLRPIREVWAALQNIDAMKWVGADRESFTRVDHPKANFTHLYTITSFKGTAIGPIEWTIEWFHGFDIGTFDLPSRVNVKFQKVKGTSNIPIWEGAITLSKVRSGVTSLGFHTNFRARQGNSENVQSAKDTISEIIKKARTAAPDWVMLNTGFHASPGIPD